MGSLTGDPLLHERLDTDFLAAALSGPTLDDDLSKHSLRCVSLVRGETSDDVELLSELREENEIGKSTTCGHNT